ncbi:unnamed protein product [Fraxinus pennsylvanica]|uniref:MORF/ORRM1/DAG-like MORF domain-containing protein n=1 Tax=Fraxinus pennsylvanica TaxID=56036 RepID=A0AAD2DIM6_9LAMI|nr:unnamed protein product [Fraxinus pennsylvanica]
MKIRLVSTQHYFAFGALVGEELSYKLKELPRVRWVLPDYYLDVKKKDYGGRGHDDAHLFDNIGLLQRHDSSFRGMTELTVGSDADPLLTASTLISCSCVDLAVGVALL